MPTLLLVLVEYTTFEPSLKHSTISNFPTSVTAQYNQQGKLLTLCSKSTSDS